MAVAARNDPEGRGRTWVGLPELLALRHTLFRSPFQFGGEARAGSARLASLRARGMEFDEVRAWQPGDDPRHMHWKATARTGRPYTKLYREESERPTLLCVDLTPRMHFATVGAFKSVLAARVAMMIAWGAIGARDRVSGLVMSADGLAVTPPLYGRRGAQQLARALAGVFQDEAGPDGPDGAGAVSLEHAVPLLQRHAPSGSRIVLVSDFTGADDAEAAQRLAARRPLLIVHLYDPLDEHLPPPGRYSVRDARGDTVFDSGDEIARRRWNRDFARRTKALGEIARSSGGAYLQIRTDHDPAVDITGHTPVTAMRRSPRRRVAR